MQILQLIIFSSNTQTLHAFFLHKNMECATLKHRVSLRRVMNIQDAVTQIHLAARYIGRDASSRDLGHHAMKPIQRKSQPLPLNPVFFKNPLDDEFFHYSN